MKEKKQGRKSREEENQGWKEGRQGRKEGNSLSTPSIAFSVEISGG